MNTQITVNKITSSLIFLLLGSFYLGVSSSSLDCDRLYFEHPSEKTFPYIHLVNKIYVKTGEVKDNYPVYKDERGDIYFSYSKRDDKFYFTTESIDIKDFAGFKMKNIHIIKYKEVGMIFYYSTSDSVNITAKCVSFIDFADNNLVVQHYDENDKAISTFNFAPIENIIVNYRRVYFDDQSRLKLYYSYKGFWRIGRNYSSTTYFVKSNAIKPEFIGQRWRKKISSDSWKNVNIFTDCHGSETTECTTGSCKNSGICNQNRFGDSFCTCQYNYYGQFCQRIKHRKCSGSPSIKGVSIEFGAIRSEFCAVNSILPFRALVCSRGINGKFYWKGTSCVSLPMIGKFRSGDSRFYDNSDDNEQPNGVDHIFQTALKVLVVVIPVLFLLIAHCCLHMCISDGCFPVTRTISKHAYLGTFVWLIYIIVYQESSITKYGPETSRYMFYVAIVFAALGYLFVLFESICCSKEGKFKSSFDGDSGETYIKSLTEKPPVIAIHMTCYHEERRSRQVSYTDARGETRRRTEHYTVDVSSWTGKEIFNFNFWKDTSDIGNLPKVTSANPVLRINIKKRIKFAIVATQQEFHNLKDTFVRNNQDRDTYHRETVTQEIPGLKKHTVLYDNEQGLPSWMKITAFVFSTILLCSWPYRLLLKRNTCMEKFEIIKYISNTPFNTTQFSNTMNLWE